MGGRSPEARAKSLLGNLANKIFHANSDFETNRWASDIIGKEFVSMNTASIDFNKPGSMSLSDQLHDQFPPNDFMKLKSGTKSNNYIVEGIVIITGKEWTDEKNFLKVRFSQR